MEYSWQFDPLEPDKPVELTCDGVVIATTTLNNAKELAGKLNSQADLYKACKKMRDYLDISILPAEVKLVKQADKALAKAEGGQNG